MAASATVNTVTTRPAQQPQQSTCMVDCTS
jgi:hypothetical protein